MLIAEQIKEKLSSIPDGVVLTLKDFKVEPQHEVALVKFLSRFVAKGELEKLSEGRYYKPRKTIFGTLKPASSEIAKDFLEKDGKMIGYITGKAAFATMGLTTQITSSIMIGSNKYRRPLKRGEYKISFLLQSNEIDEQTVHLLRILDAIRLIREIPAVTPDECAIRIGQLIKNLSEQEQQKLCELAISYTPYVCALLGVIMEMNDINTNNLKASLSGVTTYKLPISDDTLSTKLEYRMKLHENKELFADAILAASLPKQEGGLGIKSIFIEKDYWICRSLSLMVENDQEERAIFKGGTSLTKAYSIGFRFSEDIDIAIAEAWSLSGNQLKSLIRKTAKNMTLGLSEINISGSTSKGSHYYKAFYNYPREVESTQVGAIKAG